jgi:hypothetical protein
MITLAFLALFISQHQPQFACVGNNAEPCINLTPRHMNDLELDVGVVGVTLVTAMSNAGEPSEKILFELNGRCECMIERRVQPMAKCRKIADDLTEGWRADDARLRRLYPDLFAKYHQKPPDARDALEATLATHCKATP